MTNCAWAIRYQLDTEAAEAAEEAVAAEHAGPTAAVAPGQTPSARPRRHLYAVPSPHRVTALTTDAESARR